MSLNLQQALNAGSGVNLRGKVGDYFENMVNAMQNQAFNSAEVEVNAGTPADLQTTVDLQFSVMGVFQGVKTAPEQIKIEGDTVPIGDACAWLIYATTPTKTDVVQSQFCESIPVAIDDLLVQNVALFDACMFSVLGVIADSVEYVPGVTSLEDAGLITFISNTACFPQFPPSQWNVDTSEPILPEAP